MGMREATMRDDSRGSWTALAHSPFAKFVKAPNVTFLQFSAVIGFALVTGWVLLREHEPTHLPVLPAVIAAVPAASEPLAPSHEQGSKRATTSLPS